MTGTQKPIHHPDVSASWEWHALRSETLLHSHVERAAGCSSIWPRGTHKSLDWTCPLWPFISAIKSSCCSPALTQKHPATSSQALIALADHPLRQTNTVTMTLYTEQVLCCVNKPQNVANFPQMNWTKIGNPPDVLLAFCKNVCYSQITILKSILVVHL